MLVTQEFKVQVGLRPSPPLLCSFKMGSWALGHRAASGSAGAARNSAREEDGQSGGFSHESEHDLAAMVSDFWENASSGAESRYSSDSESGFPELHHLAERVLVCKQALEQNESSLSSAVHALISSIKETDLQHAKDAQCNGSCIRWSLVKLLRSSGYDAAICSSKWQGVNKVPGGDHEYVDVLIHGYNELSERLIIDIDFRSHFEIARAVESYDTILSSLPVVYVGSLNRLAQLLQVMAEAAKCSLKQNSMPLPPWRSLSYLQAKWHSPYDRKPVPEEYNVSGEGYSDHKQCTRHLRKLKASFWSEIDAENPLKPMPNDKNRRAKFERWRPSPLSS